MNKLINIEVDERLLRDINILMALRKIDDENAKLKIVTKENKTKQQKLISFNAHEMISMNLTKQKWGSWIFKENLSLVLLSKNEQPIYEIDLEKLNDTYSILNTILHLGNKQPVGISYDIKNLIIALSEIFKISHIQNNKKFSGQHFALNHLEKLNNK